MSCEADNGAGVEHVTNENEHNEDATTKADEVDPIDCRSEQTHETSDKKFKELIENLEKNKDKFKGLVENLEKKMEKKLQKQTIIGSVLLAGTIGVGLTIVGSLILYFFF